MLFQFREQQVSQEFRRCCGMGGFFTERFNGGEQRLISPPLLLPDLNLEGHQYEKPRQAPGPLAATTGRDLLLLLLLLRSQQAAVDKRPLKTDKCAFCHGCY